MRRDPDSARSINFVLRNIPNFASCKNHIEKHLSYYKNIKNYEFKDYKKDIHALYVYDNDITYICYLDTKFIELKLISSIDDYQHYETFIDDSCWAMAIEKLSQIIEGRVN